jgi:putative protein-disulfide isomerase
MKLVLVILIALISMVNTGCHFQNKKTMDNKNNPLICDPESGVCEIPTHKTNSADIQACKQTKNQ